MKYLLAFFIFLFFGQATFSAEWVKKMDTYISEVDKYRFHGLDCPDGQTLYALSNYAEFTRIYKSTDQGNTWFISYERNGTEGSPPYHINPSTGMSPHPDYYYFGYKDGGAFITRSSDGGETFDFVDLNFNYGISDIEMYDENYGFASGDYGGFFVTKDGWDTFEKIEDDGEGELFKPSGGLNQMDFADKNTLFARIVQTEGNNIAKWNIPTGNWKLLPVMKSLTLTDIHFVNNNLGFVTGGNRNGNGLQESDIIYRTKDAGDTWELVLDQEFSPISGLLSISFKDELNGIATGQFGKILQTSDGGDTWEYTLMSSIDGIVQPGPTGMSVVWTDDYAVISTSGGEIIRLETVSGIEEELLSGKSINIRIAGDRLLISIEDEKFNKYNFQIVDLNGNIIKETKFNSGVGTLFRPIDISYLKAGAYFYRISINNLIFESGKFTRIN